MLKNVGDRGDGETIVRTLPAGMGSGSVPSGVSARDWIVSYTALGKVRRPCLTNIPPEGYI